MCTVNELVIESLFKEEPATKHNILQIRLFSPLNLYLTCVLWQYSLGESRNVMDE